MITILHMQNIGKRSTVGDFQSELGTPSRS
jgi:hypothetical protein